MSTQPKDWPHAPIHRLNSDGVFMVTGATMYKDHFFSGTERLRLLEGKLLTLAKEYLWHLEAWAVFSNHYHLIARGSNDAGDLGIFLKHFHGVTARELNALENKAGASGVVQFLGHKVNLRTVLFGSPELCSSKPGEARTRRVGESVSVVFCRLVGTNGFASDGKDDLQLQDG